MANTTAANITRRDEPRASFFSRSQAMQVPSGRRARLCVLQARARALFVSLHVGFVRRAELFPSFGASDGDAVGGSGDCDDVGGRGASDA